jgi:hypothetical protein
LTRILAAVPFVELGSWDRKRAYQRSRRRVVGRLPDLTGANDPAYLIVLLGTAANWKSLTAGDYAGHFAISADVWKESLLRPSSRPLPPQSNGNRLPERSL